MLGIIIALILGYIIGLTVKEMLGHQGFEFMLLNTILFIILIVSIVFKVKG